MPHLSTRPRAARSRGPRARRRTVKAALPIAVWLVAATAFVSVALAKAFTLTVAKHASVTNMMKNTTVKEAVVANSKGFLVYTLSGDSKSHPKCTKTSGCFTFWPPVKVSSMKKLSKAPGIKGKLGTWKRNGFTQVTLGGHPLYLFFLDKKKDAGMGEGIKSFGGTWHVVKVKSSSSPSKSGQTPSPPMPPSPPYPSGW